MNWERAPLRSMLPLGYAAVKDLIDKYESMLLIGVFFVAWLGAKVGNTWLLVSLLGVAVLVLNYFVYLKYQFNTKGAIFAVKEGLFLKKANELGVEDIERADVQQNFLHQILGLYEVKLFTKGSTSAAIKFKAIDAKSLQQFEQWLEQEECDDHFTVRFTLSDNLKGVMSTPLGYLAGYLQVLIILFLMGVSVYKGEESSIEKAQKAGESYTFTGFKALPEIENINATGFGLVQLLQGAQKGSGSDVGVELIWYILVLVSVLALLTSVIGYISEYWQNKLVIRDGELLIDAGLIKRRKSSVSLSGVTHISYRKGAFGLLPWYGLELHTLSGSTAIHFLRYESLTAVLEKVGYSVFEAKVHKVGVSQLMWNAGSKGIFAFGFVAYWMLFTNQELMPTPLVSIAADSLLLFLLIAAPYALSKYFTSRIGVGDGEVIYANSTLGCSYTVVKREDIYATGRVYLFGKLIGVNVMHGGDSGSFMFYPESDLQKIVSLSPSPTTI